MKLAICMCCRNVEETLPHVFKNILLLEKYSPMLVIVYDNCKDNTERIIKTFLNDYKFNKYLIHLGNNISMLRTERIANARNACLNVVNNSDIDFHIMIDCDEINIKPWDINLIDYYINLDNWDSISFNGNNTTLKGEGYYDKWALLIDNLKWHVWGYGESSRYLIPFVEKYVSNKLQDSINEEIECHSAFNGFAIYRTKKFKECMYLGKISEYPKNFFKKEDINKSISFILGLPGFKNVGVDVRVNYPLNSEKNVSSIFKKGNCVKILPDEICEHIYYHLSAKKKGLSIKICKKNITKN